MIDAFDDDKIIASVNIYTSYPNIPGVLKRMESLIEFVEKSEYKVMACSAFWRMKHAIEVEKSYMCRGAHAFRFWFDYPQAAALFYSLFGGTYEKPPVLPTRRPKE